jgi:signal transduction histidine kinase
MRERALLVAGNLGIGASRHGGTSVTLTLPAAHEP